MNDEQKDSAQSVRGVLLGMNEKDDVPDETGSKTCTQKSELLQTELCYRSRI